MRAYNAITQGKYKDEIVPIKVRLQNPSTLFMKEVVVDTDQGKKIFLIPFLINFFIFSLFSLFFYFL
jgi:hypothetical protein